MRIKETNSDPRIADLSLRRHHTLLNDVEDSTTSPAGDEEQVVVSPVATTTTNVGSYQAPSNIRTGSVYSDADTYGSAVLRDSNGPPMLPPKGSKGQVAHNGDVTDPVLSRIRSAVDTNVGNCDTHIQYLADHSHVETITSKHYPTPAPLCGSLPPTSLSHAQQPRHNSLPFAHVRAPTSRRSSMSALCPFSVSATDNEAVTPLLSVQACEAGSCIHTLAHPPTPLPAVGSTLANPDNATFTTVTPPLTTTLASAHFLGIITAGSPPHMPSSRTHTSTFGLASPPRQSPPTSTHASPEGVHAARIRRPPTPCLPLPVIARSDSAQHSTAGESVASDAKHLPTSHVSMASYHQSHAGHTYKVVTSSTSSAPSIVSAPLPTLPAAPATLPVLPQRITTHPQASSAAINLTSSRLTPSRHGSQLVSGAPALAAEATAHGKTQFNAETCTDASSSIPHPNIPLPPPPHPVQVSSAPLPAATSITYAATCSRSVSADVADSLTTVNAAPRESTIPPDAYAMCARTSDHGTLASLNTCSLQSIELEGLRSSAPLSHAPAAHSSAALCASVPASMAAPSIATARFSHPQTVPQQYTSLVRPSAAPLTTLPQLQQSLAAVLRPIITQPHPPVDPAPSGLRSPRVQVALTAASGSTTVSLPETAHTLAFPAPSSAQQEQDLADLAAVTQAYSAMHISSQTPHQQQLMIQAHAQADAQLQTQMQQWQLAHACVGIVDPAQFSAPVTSYTSSVVSSGPHSYSQQQRQLQAQYQLPYSYAPSQTHPELRPLPLPLPAQTSSSSLRMPAPMSASGPAPVIPFPTSPSFLAASPYTYLNTAPVHSPLFFPTPYPASTAGSFPHSSPVASQLMPSAAPSPLASLGPYAQSVNSACMPVSASLSCNTFPQDALASSLPSPSQLNHPPAFCTPVPSPQAISPLHTFTPHPQMQSPLTLTSLASPRKVIAQHVSFSASVATDASNSTSTTTSVPPTQSTQHTQQVRAAVTPARPQPAPTPTQLQPNAQSEPSAKYRRMSMTGFAPVRPFAPSVSSNANPSLLATVSSTIPYTASTTVLTTATVAAASSAVSPTAEERDSATSAVSAIITGSEHMALSNLSPTKERTLVQAAAVPARAASSSTMEPAAVTFVPHPPAHPRTSLTPVLPRVGSPMRRGTTPGRTNTCPGSSPARSPERPVGPSARPLRTLTSPMLPTARIASSQAATTPSLHTSGPSVTASPVAADTTTDTAESLLSSPDASPAAQSSVPQMLIPSPPALPASKAAFPFSPVPRLKRNSAPAQMHSPFMEGLLPRSGEDTEKPKGTAASSEHILAKDAHELLGEAHDRSVTVDGTLPALVPEQVPEDEPALAALRPVATVTITPAPAPSSAATQVKTASRRACVLPQGVDARTVHRVHASLDASLDQVPEQFCIVAPPFRSYRRSTIIAHNDNRAILGGHALLLDEPEWVSGRGPHWDLTQLCHTIAADNADMLSRYLAEGLSPHTLLGRVRYFVPTRACTSNAKAMPTKKAAKSATLPMLPDEEDDVGVSIFPEFSSPHQTAHVKSKVTTRSAATGGLAGPSMVRVMSMPSVPALAVDSVDIDALNDVDVVDVSARVLSTPRPDKIASLTAPTNVTRGQRVVSLSGSEKSESRLRPGEHDGWVYEYPAAREVLPCATPLLLAIGWGAVRCLKVMLDAGVDVNYMPKGTDAPPLLHLALYCNVIDEGDDMTFSPPSSDSDASSPSEVTTAEKLVSTCTVSKPHERRLDIMHVLMAHGADASYMTPRQWTFAHALLILGDIRLLYHFYDQYGCPSPGRLITGSITAQDDQHCLEVREGETENPYLMHVLSTVNLPECPRSPSYCIFHRYFFLACAMLFQSMDAHAQVPKSVPTVALRVACMCAEVLAARAAATELRHNCLVFTMEDLVKLVERAKESDVGEPVDNVSEALQDKQSIARNSRRTCFDCDLMDDSSIGGSSCYHAAERARSKDARSTASKPLVVGVTLPPQPLPRPTTSAAPAHRSRRRSDADLPLASAVATSALAQKSDVREREQMLRDDRRPRMRNVRDAEEAKEYVADRGETASGETARTPAREARESQKKDKKDRKDRRDVITGVQDVRDDRVRGRQEEQAPRPTGLIKVGEGRPAIDLRELRELRETREAKDVRDVRGTNDARDVQDRRTFQQASPTRVEGRRPVPPRVERDTNRSRDPRDHRTANACNPSASGSQTNTRSTRLPMQSIAVHATPLIRFQREVGELAHRHQEMRDREGRESFRDALFPPRESEIARDSRALASAQPPHRRLQGTRRGTVQQGIHPSPYQPGLRGRVESDSADNKYLTVPSNDDNYVHVSVALGSQTPLVAGKTGTSASPNVSFSQLPQRAVLEPVPMIDDFAFEVEDAQRFVSNYQRMSTDPSGIAPPLPMTVPRDRSRRGSQDMPRTPDRTHAVMERSSPPHPFRGRASPAATGAPRPQLGPGPSRMPTRSDTAYSSGQPRGK